MNPGIYMGNAAFNTTIIYTNQLDLRSRMKPMKYIWNIVWYGAETWTFRKVDQKYLDSFEIWCWRRMEMINWTERVRCEYAYHNSLRGKKHPTYKSNNLRVK